MACTSMGRHNYLEDGSVMEDLEVPWDGVWAHIEEKILVQKMVDGLPDSMEGVHLVNDEEAHQ